MRIEEMAQMAVETAIEKYWDDEEDFLREYYPYKSDAVKFSFLWGYGAYLTMLTTHILKTGDKKFMPHMDKAFERLELYRSQRKDFRCYNSHPDIYGGGEPYYDDNAWVVLAFLDAYKITGDKKYLGAADETAQYLYSGWNPVVGGIFWKEIDCVSSNTCSSAPTVVAALGLYKLLGERKHLDWALRIYQWCRDNLRDSDGVYFDNIENDGTVHKEKYTYNTGVMIWAGMILHEITGENVYLEDALISGKGAMNWLGKNVDSYVEVWPETPWFNVYLIKGLLSLGSCVGADECLKRLTQYLEGASDGLVFAQGLIYADWKGNKTYPNPYYLININAMGSAECLSLLAKGR